MKKTLMAATAAAIVAAGAAFGPAIAQTASVPAQHAKQRPLKEVTRAELLQKVQQHFAKVDLNRDGFVTQAEIASARTAMRANAGERRAERFDRLDANNDGAISRREFDAAHQARGDRRGHGGRRHMAGFGRHMFAMADANKDGRVALQEATAAAATHFDRADLNRDGRLTGDEMRQAHKEMRASR